MRNTGVFTMIGSFAGIVLSVLLAFTTIEKGALPDLQGASLLLMGIPAAIIFAYVLIYSLALAPLHKAEQNTTPRLLDMFKQDPLLGFNHLGLIALPLFAFTLGLDANALHFTPAIYILGGWFILVGASLDLLVQFLRRILSYLNPFTVTRLFQQAAKRSIQNDREADLCEWIDALAEVAGRSLDKNGGSLCNQALNELYEIIRLFLEASKSIGHPDTDKQSLELGIKDKVTFTLFYLFDRLDMLFLRALKKRQEPVCSNILTVFGKITIEAAKYDMSLASFPLQYIGKLGFNAHQTQLQSLGLKTTCLYLELARALLNEIDITYLELQEPFFTLIHHMDEIAKESFKQNKNTPIKALVQPFQDLKHLFAQGKAASHQDTPKIVADIDRVIAEFDALALVLMTIPTIPELNQPETAPEKPT